MNITNSVFTSVALDIQHECSVLFCLSPFWRLSGFSAFIRYSSIFGKVTEHKMCSFCTSLSEIFLILRIIKRDITINLHANSHLLSDILMSLELSRKIFKNKIPNFMKIRPVGDEFLRADGHTYMTVLTDTCCNFTNGPKKWVGLYIHSPSTNYSWIWTAPTSHFKLDKKDCISSSCT